MNPLVAAGAAATVVLLAFGFGGKKKAFATSAPNEIKAKAGTDYALDIAATGIDANKLRQTLYAAVEARGNFILEFEATRPDRYRVVVHFGKADTILLNQPVKNKGVVVTTLSARKV